MKKLLILILIYSLQIFAENEEILKRIIPYKDNPNFDLLDKKYLDKVKDPLTFGVLLGDNFLEYNTSLNTDSIRFTKEAMEAYFGFNIKLIFYKNMEELSIALNKGYVDFTIGPSSLENANLKLSPPLFNEEFGVFYTSKKLDITKTVYVTPSFSSIKLVENSFNKNIKIEKSEDLPFNLLESGKNVFDSSFGIRTYLNMQIKDLKFKSFYSDYKFFIYNENFDKKLMKIINKGINYDLGDIIREYSHNFERDNKISLFALNLTDDEKEYIRKNPILNVFLQKDFFPMAFYNPKTKKFDGFFVDLLDEFVSLTGQKLQIINSPDEKINELKGVENNLLFILTEQSFLDENFITSEDSFTEGILLIGAENSKVYSGNPMDYSSHSIAFVQNSLSHDIAKEFYQTKKIPLQEHNSYEELIKALDSGKVQYGIVPESIFKYYKIINEKGNLKVVARFKELNLPLAVNRESGLILDIFKKTKELKLIDYYKIFNQWETYTINYEQELNSKNKIIENELKKQQNYFKFISFFTLSVLALSMILVLMYKRVKELNKHLYKETYYEPNTDLPNKRLFLEEKEKIHLNIGDGILCLSIVNQNELNQLYNFEEGEQIQKSICSFLGNFFLVDVIEKFYYFNSIYVIILRKNEKTIEDSVDLIRKMFKEKFENSLQIKVSYSIKEEDTDSLDKVFEQSYFLINSSSTEKLTKASTKIIDDEKEIIYLSKDLMRALEDREIVPFFQAKISASTGEVTGVEALARWLHKEKGIIPPYKFIEKAEQNGNIIEVDLRIAELSIAAYKRWILKDLVADNFILSFNLSPKTLALNNIAEIIIEFIHKYRVNPQNIEVEVTERVVIENYEHFKNIITKFREIGILVAIDDFSAGNASLDYILKIEFTTLKIDRSLLTGISSDNKKKIEIYKAIVDIGKKLNMRIIAEGVETFEEVNLIRSFEVDEIQGYFYSKPIDEEKFIQYVEDNYNKD